MVSQGFSYLNKIPESKKTIPKTVIVKLKENNEGEKCTVLAIIRGAIAGDDIDKGRGRVYNNKDFAIAFGPWLNMPCKRGGDGWYVKDIGSCFKGNGSLIKRLQWVEVVVINEPACLKSIPKN